MLEYPKKKLEELELEDSITSNLLNNWFIATYNIEDSLSLKYKLTKMGQNASKSFSKWHQKAFRNRFSDAFPHF